MNNARDTTRKDSIGRMGSTNQNGGRSSYLMDAIHHLAGNRYIVYRLGRPAANLVPRSLVAEKKVKKNEDKTNRTKKKPKRKWRRRRVTFVENLSRNVAGAWRRLLNNGCRERERENKKKVRGSTSTWLAWPIGAIVAAHLRSGASDWLPEGFTGFYRVFFFYSVWRVSVMRVTPFSMSMRETYRIRLDWIVDFTGFYRVFFFVIIS